MHIVSTHLPDFYERLGDLMDFAGEGLEHLHSIRKTQAHRQGNKRKEHTNKNGVQVKGRMWQLMEIETGLHKLHEVVPMRLAKKRKPK